MKDVLLFRSVRAEGKTDRTWKLASAHTTPAGIPLKHKTDREAELQAPAEAADCLGEEAWSSRRNRLNRARQHSS